MSVNGKSVTRIALLLLAIITLASAAIFSANHNWNPINKSSTANRILVEKSARRLTLFDGIHPIKTYVVSLGRSPAGQKKQQGDNRTPEGIYFIDSRNSESKYHLSLHISYPKAEDRIAAEKNGTPPGGDIMIHGMPDGYGWIGAFHRGYDWTAGCIAVTDFEMDELWNAVPTNTRIEIRP